MLTGLKRQGKHKHALIIEPDHFCQDLLLDAHAQVVPLRHCPLTHISNRWSSNTFLVSAFFCGGGPSMSVISSAQVPPPGNQEFQIKEFLKHARAHAHCDLARPPTTPALALQPHTPPITSFTSHRCQSPASAARVSHERGGPSTCVTSCTRAQPILADRFCIKTALRKSPRIAICHWLMYH